MQVIQIGLGTLQNTTNLWKVNYDYGEITGNDILDTEKNNGTIARQTINFSGLNQAFVQTYQYDTLNRLVLAKEASDTTQNWIQNFGYDRYGNRTSFNQLIGQEQQNQTPTIDPINNRFSTEQGFVYDLNGNLITDNQNRQFTFNGDNKQVEVKDAANNVIGKYYYDGTGKRVKKVSISDTTIFVYNASGNLVAEYSTQTTSNPTISYLTIDSLGSPRVITDNGGNVISRRDFMPFGEDLYAGATNRTVVSKYGATGADNIRKRFAGYEKDTETKLDFAEARYYNNQHGRFTAVDPLLASGMSANPQTFNRYVYVANNPVVLTDPTGMFIEAWTHGGALMNYGTQFIDNPFNWIVQQAQQPQTSRVPSASEIVRNNLQRTLAQDTRERLSHLFSPMVTTLSGNTTGTTSGSTSIGYGRVISSSRQTQAWKWMWAHNLQKVTDAGVAPDVTTAEVVFSAFNVGESPYEMPLYDKFGRDQSGHIIGKALGGGGSAQNLFSQSGRVNQGAYKIFETSIRKILTEDQSLTAKITVSLFYNPGGFISAGTALAMSQEDKFRPIFVTYDVQFVNPQGQTVKTLSEWFTNTRWGW